MVAKLNRKSFEFKSPNFIFFSKFRRENIFTISTRKFRLLNVQFNSFRSWKLCTSNNAFGGTCLNNKLLFYKFKREFLFWAALKRFDAFLSSKQTLNNIFRLIFSSFAAAQHISVCGSSEKWISQQYAFKPQVCSCRRYSVKINHREQLF